MYIKIIGANFLFPTKFRQLILGTFFIVFMQLFLCNNQLFATAARIYLDGAGADWDSLNPVYTDLNGDQLSGELDFGKLWLTNDENFLYFRIEVGQAINLQDNNEITLYLDTDNRSSTGKPVAGIGAELQWNFGAKMGYLYQNSSSSLIYQGDIGVVTAPTVSSDEFEIALDRSAAPQGYAYMQMSDTLRVAFIDLASGQDSLPNSGDLVQYIWDYTALEALAPRSLKKANSRVLRVMTYNVLSDGLFDAERSAYFDRIIGAVQPDIIGFEEIYNYSAQETRDRVAEILDAGDTQSWHAAQAEPDIIVVSHYPILETYPVEGNGAFLIDLQEQYSQQLLLIVAHPPCCANNEGRQYELDAIMAFIRDAKQSGGALNLSENSPVMIIGDLNLVGYARQLQTVLSGTIVNQDSFGPSFSPDWDGTDFADLSPRLTATPAYFTWYNPSSTYSPGRLDFIIYSDSVLEPLRSFVLFTPDMPTDSLDRYGLLSTDAILASDHLPVVGDFDLLSGSSVLDTQDYPMRLPEIKRIKNYPNPCNPMTTISYEITQAAHVLISVYDLQGRLIANLVNQNVNAGDHSIEWDFSDLSSGVYLYRIQVIDPVQNRAGSEVKTRKMVLMK